MSAAVSDEQRKTIGRPFRPGQSGNPGGRTPKKLRKVRKALEKLDDKAMTLLEKLMDDPDSKVAAKALELWAKYRLPVPKEPLDVNISRPTPILRPEIAARLAKLDA